MYTFVQAAVDGGLPGVVVAALEALIYLPLQGC
jgi:hypothetical protein